MKSTALLFFIFVLLMIASIHAQENMDKDDIGTVFKVVDTPLNGNGRKDWVLTSTEDKKIPIGDQQVINFIATPLSGDVDLFVSTQGQPQVNHGHCSNCISEGVTAHGEIVTLAYNSPNYPSGETYNFYIAVLTHDNTPAAFTFTVTVSDQGEDKPGTTTNLEPGYPQVGHVGRSQYDYYKFKLADEEEIKLGEEGKDIIISVTSVGTGDPDIYVGTNEGDKATTRPTSDKYYWKSDRWGSDQIVIKNDDANYPSDNTVYIGVKGFSQSDSYFIINVAGKRTYAIIMDGGGMTYRTDTDLPMIRYKFVLAKAQQLSFVTTPISFRGDPDIYVTDEVTPEEPVSPGHSKWRSSGMGSDRITIVSDKPPNEPGAKAWFYIAIRTYKATTYSVMVTTEGTPITVEAGKPLQAITETGKPTFFKYYHVDKYADLNMVAQPANLNPVNVYISTPNSNNPKPDISSNDAVAFISGTQSHWTLPQASEGLYYFGVYPTSWGPQNFTFSVTTNSSIGVLRDGVTQYYNSIARDGYRYFMFQIQDKLEQEIMVTVAPQGQSEVDVYVSTGEVLTRPTKDSCGDDKCWSSSSYKADSIIIRPEDTLVTEDTRVFFIGVAGRVYDNNFFRIVAFTSDKDIQLIDGQSMPGSVEKGKYMYYKFRCEKAEKVDIELFQSSPSRTLNVDLFGSFETEKPDHENCRTYNCDSSTNIGENDRISIKVRTAPRWYYIAVYGAATEEDKPIPFKITARESYHVIDHYHSSIFEQTSKDEVQQIHVSSIYSFAKFATITNTLISGRTALYLNANNTGIDELNLDSTLYADDSWPGNAIVVKNEGEHPVTKIPMSAYFKNNEWSIGVKALVDSNYVASAHLSHFFPFDAFVLRSLPHLSAVPSRGSLHFYYQVPYENFASYGKELKEDLILSVRVLRGFVNIYVASDYRVAPNPENSFFNHTGTRNSVLVLPKDKLRQGYPVFVTATGADSGDSVFELTIASKSEPQYLTQDQPALNDVAKNAPSYFKILNLVSQYDEKDAKIEIWAESCSNKPAPQLHFSTVYAKPNTSHSEVTAYPSNLVTRLSTTIKNHAQVYYVQADAGDVETSNRFSIAASTQGFILPILNDDSIKGDARFEAGNYHVTLKVSPATRPVQFKDKPLIYSFFFHEVADANSVVNMRTACGVLSNLLPDGSYYEDVTKPGDITHTKILDGSKVYQLNVLVNDGFGMSAVYRGVFFKEGEFYDGYPDLLNTAPVSVGTILITIIFTVFMLYMLIGCFIRVVVMGKDGADIIPNKEFWMDLPFLFVDGIKFIVTCGRRSTSYNSMIDTNVDDTGYEETTTNKTQDAQKINDVDGYGGI